MDKPFVDILWTRWNGDVVQLVRTPACHAGGRGFEPHRLRHIFRYVDLGLSDAIDRSIYYFFIDTFFQI